MEDFAGGVQSGEEFGKVFKISMRRYDAVLRGSTTTLADSLCDSGRADRRAARSSPSKVLRGPGGSRPGACAGEAHRGCWAQSCSLDEQRKQEIHIHQAIGPVVVVGCQIHRCRQ